MVRLDKRIEIFLVVVVGLVIIGATYQLMRVLEALIPLVIVLVIGIVILIYLSKKGIIQTPKIVKDILKKKK